MPRSVEKLVFRDIKYRGLNIGTMCLCRTDGDRITSDDQNAEQQTEAWVDHLHPCDHWLSAPAQPLDDQKCFRCSVPV